MIIYVFKIIKMIPLNKKGIGLLPSLSESRQK
jgi:hypothetical protein